MEANNGNSIVVREITNAEEAFKVLTIFKEYEFLEKVKDDETRRAYAEKWAKQSNFLVAYCGEDVVGCFIMYTENTVDDCAFITYIVTRNDVGMISSFAMLNMWVYAISILRKKNLSRIKTETAKTNKKAQAASKAIGLRYTEDASEDTIFLEATVDELESRIEKLRSLLNRGK